MGRQNRSFFVRMDPPDKRRPAAERPKKTVKKKTEASPAREASVFQNYRILIARLAAASILFAFVQVSALSPILNTVLLALCAILAGYDIILEAITALKWGTFLSEPVILSVVTLVSFLIGFSAEGAALPVIYQAMKLLVLFASDKTLVNSLGLISGREEEIRSLAEDRLKNEDSCLLRIGAVLDRTLTPVLALAAAIAVIYALVITWLFHYNIRVSIHRCIMILLICTPYSALISMPLIGKMGLCTSASYGTVFTRAADLEALDGTHTVILDKDCFPDGKEARIISYLSTNLDDNTFFLLIRHLIKDARQGFAKMILLSSTSQYIPGLVSDFSEAPGGVCATINSVQALFGTRSFLSSYSVVLPEASEDEGIFYHLFLGGKYGGYVVLSESGENDVADIVHSLRYAGIHKCTLICSESAEEIAEYSQASDFDEVFAGISPSVKSDVTDELCASNSQKKVYLRVDDAQPRSTADLEIRIGKETGDSDAVTFTDYYAQIPLLFSLSKRMDEIAIENVALAFGIKVILIFLSMIGYCNLWLAVTADMAAAVITILNANRVATQSLRSLFLNR